MAVESTTTISGLNAAWPLGTDPKAEGDNHLRLIKSTLQAVFDDSGTTLKTTKPIESPAGALVGGKPVNTARNRNRIRNPVLQVSQENGSTPVSTNAAYPADQWMFGVSGMTGPSASRSALGSPSPEGTQYCLTMSVGTAKPSLAAGDCMFFLHPLEGQDIADLLWGTAGAKQAILRFNVIAVTAGIYGFSIRNGATGTRSYCGSFTVSAANTWQTISLVIPGDTTGTWVKDNSFGASLTITYATGSTLVGVTGWQAGAFIAPPGCINGAAVINSNLTITDVGLYGDPDATGVAPPFVAPAYEDDLARCMRYWENGPFPGFNGYSNPAGTAVAAPQFFKVRKRIVPTVAITSWGATNNVNGQNVTAIGTEGFIAYANLVTAGAGNMYAIVAPSNARLI